MEQTNSIIYVCECGRTWRQTYHMEIKEASIFLSRFVPLTAPADDRLCTCGKTVLEPAFETPMPGYARVRVRLLSVTFDIPRYAAPGMNQQFEQLHQLLIEEEKPFQEEQVDALEEKAHKIIKLGLTPEKWKALTPQQREGALKLQP